MTIELRPAPRFKVVRSKSGTITVDPVTLSTSVYGLSDVLEPHGSEKLLLYWTADAAVSGDRLSFLTILLDRDGTSYVAGSLVTSIPPNTLVVLDVQGMPCQVLVAAVSVTAAVNLRIHAAVTYPIDILMEDFQQQGTETPASRWPALAAMQASLAPSMLAGVHREPVLHSEDQGLSTTGAGSATSPFGPSVVDLGPLNGVPTPQGAPIMLTSTWWCASVIATVSITVSITRIPRGPATQPLPDTETAGDSGGIADCALTCYKSDRCTQV